VIAPDAGDLVDQAASAKCEFSNTLTTEKSDIRRAASPARVTTPANETAIAQAALSARQFIKGMIAP
jgi:hypothetical protein